MEKAEKAAQLEDLSKEFSVVAGAVLTGVAGLTVAESTNLRRKFHEAGVQYRVVKNTLARKAAEQGDMKVIADLFVGPTAIAWHKDDPSAAARVALKAKEELDKLELKGGYLAGSRLDAAGIKAAATMPTLPELRSMLLGTINGVAAKLLAQVNAPAQNIVGIVTAYQDKQKSEGKAA